MITVAGATGNVGSRIVRILRERGERVRALVGPGENPPWQPSEDLEVVETSFDDKEAIGRAAEGADGFFLMSPPNVRQVEWQRTQVDAAKRAGVARVVKLSAYDTGPDSEWTLGRWHWDGEIALREAGLPHAILRPQYFQENLLMNEAALRTGRLTTYIPDDRKVGAVAADDIAATAAALLTTEPLDGQVVTPTGPAAFTTREAADAVAEVLGFPVEVDYVEPERAWRELRAAGWPDWRIADRLNICLFASPEVNDDVRRVGGQSAHTFAETVRTRFA
ncbi:NmrA family NAD(P)-binding protein [Amycolatopsis jejuensis]|uniref:NmrA family NAD(P)-binding protein n=1 Tax=Amycolatopsis jejuensis TaxID=330084 RepID=UPI00052639EA|nr:NmrA family NAD(P)-binding protein [Amycolatopsis jejuensis]